MKMILAALLVFAASQVRGADPIRVIDSATNTPKVVAGSDAGGGLASIKVVNAGSAPGSSTTVKIKQPDVISDGTKVDVTAVATLIMAADSKTDHVIVSGFDQTTATVWIGNSTVTVFSGAKPGDGIVTGSPPVTYTTTGALYAIVVGPASQTIVVKKISHTIAP